MLDNHDIIKELKKFQEIRPATFFVEKTRMRLLSEMGMENTKQRKIDEDLAKNSRFLFNLHSGIFLKILKPVGTLLLILCILTSTGIGMSYASQNSMPGDIFYPVKLSIEKAQISWQTNEEDKVKLEVEFAGRRLEELNKVKESEVAENKKEPDKTKIALDNFKKNIETLNTRLEKIKGKEFTDATVDVVNMVETKTVEYAKTLEDMGKADQVIAVKNENNLNNENDGNKEEGKEREEVKEVETEKITDDAGKNSEIAMTDEQNEQDKEVNKVMKEALNASDNLSIKAADIMIEKRQNGQTTLSSKELVNKLMDKVINIKTKVEDLKQKMAALVETRLIASKKDVDNISTSTNGIIIDSADEDRIAKVDIIVNEVDGLLKREEITIAFEKMKEVKNLIKEIEDKIEMLEEQNVKKDAEVKNNTEENSAKDEGNSSEHKNESVDDGNDNATTTDTTIGGLEN